MGGIAIIFGTVVGYFGAHAVTMTPPTVSGVLVYSCSSGWAA